MPNQKPKQPKKAAAPKPPGQGTSKAARQRRNRKSRVSMLMQEQRAVRTRIAPQFEHIADVAKCLKALTMPEENDEIPIVTLNGNGIPAYTYAAKHVIRLSPAEVGTGFRAFVFRRPGANMILSCAPPTSAIWKYAFDFRSQLAPGGTGLSANGGGTWTFTAREVGSDFPIELGLMHFVSQGAGDFKKHMTDAVSSPSKKSNNSFAYLDAGEQLNFTVASDTNTTLTFSAFKYDGAQYTRAWSADIVIVGGAAATTYSHTIANSSAEGSDYYYFTVAVSANCGLSSLALNLIGSVGGSPAIHRLVCMNRYCQNISKLPSSIVIGSTLLCNNGTADLYKGGLVAQANVMATHHWQDLDDYQTISGLQASSIRPANDGSFGGLRVNDKSRELALQTNAVTSNSTTLTQLAENIESDFGYYAVAYNLTDTGGNQVFNLQLQTAAQFIPEDPIFKPELGTVTADAWEEALQKQGAIPQFTENKIHWEQIGKAILKAAETSVKAIQRYGPMIISGAQMGIKGAQAASEFLGSAAMIGAGFI